MSLAQFRAGIQADKIPGPSYTAHNLRLWSAPLLAIWAIQGCPDARRWSYRETPHWPGKGAP